MSDAAFSQSLWACLTRRCNFDCGYCYQGSHAKVPAGLLPHMPASVLERALPWAVEWTTTHLRVIWYGGEPLLGYNLIREWMPRYADAFRAAGKQVSFSCTTNGSLLTREVRDLFDRHACGVLLSLDGPPRTHDRTRVYYDERNGKRRGTWSSIPVQEILAWRPDIEIAWQLDPTIDFCRADLDAMVSLGFKNINFNLQWLAEWDADAQLRLVDFFHHAGRLMLQGVINSNFKGKLDRALTVDEKMEVPCGTGLAMLGLSPEGWLYPSQEMVYTVFEPGRAPGTPEYYRVGDVSKTPVIDRMAQARVSLIKTAQMKPPPPFSCNDCVAKSVSIGGCHCRYVGQDGADPSNRFDVAPGYCQSMRAAMTGLLRAAAIERYIRPVAIQGGGGHACAGSGKPAAGEPVPVELKTRRPPSSNQSGPVTVATVLEAVQALSRKIDALDVVRLEAVPE